MRHRQSKERRGDYARISKKTVAALTECVEALSKSGNAAQANMISTKINALVEILKVIPDRYLYVSR